ncbi:MAG: M20/M25/M40 family metallo-hydrolase [Clostridioides sp.]|nr:M20/M25/M40 family metallo-hydrolase [Clostridioides sp.]
MLNRERLQDTFIEMIKIYSPSKQEKEMCDYILNWLSKRNIQATIDDAGSNYGGNGGNIVAYIPGTTSGMPICFCAHLDQIEPCENVKPVIDGSIIKTDGTTTLGGDDKGGVAAILEAVEDILESDTPHRDIYLLFTVTEELGMLGVKNMDMSKLPCKDLIVLDSAGDTGTIAYAAPAKEHIEITFNGKKAHAGIEPENGINAIVVASKAISKMHIGRIDEETTSNIGEICGGGATNVVTDKVKFIAEIRSHSMDKLQKEVEHMENCCKEATDSMKATYIMEHSITYPTLHLDIESDICKILIDAIKEEGIEPELLKIGGGSDANILCGHGYRSGIISIGMKDVHTVDESLDIDELCKATRIIRRIMEG